MVKYRIEKVYIKNKKPQPIRNQIIEVFFVVPHGLEPWTT